MASNEKSRGLGWVLLLALVGLALFWARSSRPPVAPAAPVAVPRREMAQRDGLWHHGADTNLFTGIMSETYTNGVTMARIAISNGLVHGWTETWFANGQRQSREGFKNGVSDGLREKWFENGRKMSEATISNGVVVGNFRRWYDNGQLAEMIEMTNGQPAGVAWYPSGYVKAETTVQNGKALNRRFWKDGELKSLE
ncbi:MAG TPA: toxin-antitoxin system YwqK family antitoxin [Verrucomicrobiae bacterium]|jgi:antitoxin component YwqK of YwqJK toxin-antitoxin module|nr:toxin-antitoxin system YwqK family antitoxin [Verrucomicrobiae bacterium]